MATGSRAIRLSRSYALKVARRCSGFGVNVKIQNPRRGTRRTVWLRWRGCELIAVILPALAAYSELAPERVGIPS